MFVYMLAAVTVAVGSAFVVVRRKRKTESGAR
jgi:LPXTG-motif cell wall-anchored protein